MTAGNSRPILVTGAHRSGTTWVGKMLASSGEAAYISEPLNVLHRPGVLSAPVHHWYTYICAENEADFLPGLRDTLSFNYHLLAEIRSLRSLKDFLRMWRDGWIFLNGRLRSQRALIKDPFAVFSILWFAERLNCQAVVTVRHPAAFASSLKRLDWPFDLGDLLAQPLLMRDWLEPFHVEMEQACSSAGDSLSQSCLLWRMIYQVVLKMQHALPELRVVRHEDLSIAPVEGFRRLYAELGLRFSRQAAQAISNSSGSENPKDLTRNAVHSVHLDSQANLGSWKNRLEPGEIKRIRQLTEEVAAHFYRDQEWE